VALDEFPYLVEVAMRAADALLDDRLVDIGAHRPLMRSLNRATIDSESSSRAAID
jgi:hypothetical protein